MTDRFTRKDSERCAKRLAEKLGKKFGSCWKNVNGKQVPDIGCWNLDHNPIYGGSVIEEVISEGGAIHHPLGDRRMKPEAFCSAVRLAENAIDIDREKRK